MSRRIPAVRVTTFLGIEGGVLPGSLWLWLLFYCCGCWLFCCLLVVGCFLVVLVWLMFFCDCCAVFVHLILCGSGVGKGHFMCFSLSVVPCCSSKLVCSRSLESSIQVGSSVGVWSLHLAEMSLKLLGARTAIIGPQTKNA